MLDLRDVKVTINLRLKAIHSADIKMLIPEIPTMWVAFPSVYTSRIYIKSGQEYYKIEL